MSPITPASPQFGAPPPMVPTDQSDPLWMTQLNQNMLLTVQAFQRLHTAMDSKFTRHGHEP